MLKTAAEEEDIEEECEGYDEGPENQENENPKIAEDDLMDLEVPTNVL
jgi:hypothetical protein